VFYASQVDKAFFARWADRFDLAASALEQQFWYGPDIEVVNRGRIAAVEYYRRAGRRLNVEAELVREMIHEAFRGEFNHALADHVRAERDRGRPVCALTNGWSGEQELLARPELAGLFDFIVSSCDVGMAKPDARIYRLLLQRFGRAVEQVVFVDDTPACVEAARGLGIETVQFRDTDQAITALRG
jgi:HAD superfamily hydrolase (TIGR01509 family)